MPRLSQSQELAFRSIRDAAHAGLPLDRLAQRLMAALQLAIPVDGYRLFGLDPATRIVNRVLAASDGDDWARLEYLQQVYLAFGPQIYAELSNVLRAGIRVAAFHDRQGMCWGYPGEMLGAMSPAAHYRFFHEIESPLGGGIQATFPANGALVAALQLYRREAGAAFRRTDVAFIDLVRVTIGTALGAALARERTMRATIADGAAGVMVLGSGGTIDFATPDGERLIDLISTAEGGHRGALPTAIWSALAQMHSEHNPAAVGAVEVETRAGAIRIEATPGRDGGAAVVLTPCRPPALPEVPPDWGLTAQEREVVRLVLGGASNRAIGERLSIAEHTVESHLRGAYARLEVHGRGELLARYFRETFYPGIEAELG